MKKHSPPPSPEQVAEMAQRVALGMAAMAEISQSFIDAAVGYRQRAIGAGLPEELANAMAAQYHQFVLGHASSS